MPHTSRQSGVAVGDGTGAEPYHHHQQQRQQRQASRRQHGDHSQRRQSRAQAGWKGEPDVRGESEPDDRRLITDD